MFFSASLQSLALQLVRFRNHALPCTRESSSPTYFPEEKEGERRKGGHVDQLGMLAKFSSFKCIALRVADYSCLQNGTNRWTIHHFSFAISLLQPQCMYRFLHVPSVHRCSDAKKQQRNVVQLCDYAEIPFCSLISMEYSHTDASKGYHPVKHF